jgi:hypothetical protein
MPRKHPGKVSRISKTPFALSLLDRNFRVISRGYIPTALGLLPGNSPVLVS